MGRKYTHSEGPNRGSIGEVTVKVALRRRVRARIAVREGIVELCV